MILLFLCILSVNGQIRLGKSDGLQKQMVVQRKQVERHDVVFALYAKTNRFIQNGLQFKRTTDRLGKLLDGMIPEQLKHFDVLPDAEFFARRRDEPTTQHVEFLR
jgi:hypothetical protein